MPGEAGCADALASAAVRPLRSNQHSVRLVHVTPQRSDRLCERRDLAVDIPSMLGPFGCGEEFVNLVVAAHPKLQPCLSRARWYVGTLAVQEGFVGRGHDNKDAFE